MFQNEMNVQAHRARMKALAEMGWNDTVVHVFLDTLAPTAKQVCKHYYRLLRHQIMTTKHTTTLLF